MTSMFSILRKSLSGESQSGEQSSNSTSPNPTQENDGDHEPDLRKGKRNRSGKVHQSPEINSRKKSKMVKQRRISKSDDDTPDTDTVAAEASIIPKETPE